MVGSSGLFFFFGINNKSFGSFLYFLALGLAKLFYLAIWLTTMSLDFACISDFVVGKEGVALAKHYCSKSQLCVLHCTDAIDNVTLILWSFLTY